MPVTGRERQVQQSHQQTNIISVNSPNQRKKSGVSATYSYTCKQMQVCIYNTQ